MMSVLGFVLPHDDSVNDRSEGSKLNNADEVTRALWHQAYGISFGRPGSMYRGAPPKAASSAARMLELTEGRQKSLLSPWGLDLMLDSVQVHDVPFYLRESAGAFNLQVSSSATPLNSRRGNPRR